MQLFQVFWGDTSPDSVGDILANSLPFSKSYLDIAITSKRIMNKATELRLCTDCRELETVSESIVVKFQSRKEQLGG